MLVLLQSIALYATLLMPVWLVADRASAYIGWCANSIACWFFIPDDGESEYVFELASGDILVWPSVDYLAKASASRGLK